MRNAYLILSIFTASLAPVFAPGAGAVAAWPQPIQYRQPDGSVIGVTLRGDESLHWYEDSRGRVFLPDSAGFLMAAPTDRETLQRRLAAKSPKRVKASLASQGAPTTPVILVEFKDSEFTYAKDVFQNLLSQNGFDFEGANGSVADYFRENSDGLFNPSFEVLGPIKLKNESEYYARDNDVRAFEMVKEALAQLDDEVDFSRFDNDRDGIIDNIYIYYCGRGKADGGGENTIWPHSANLVDLGARFYADGVMAGRYACSNEIRNATGRLAGIGTFCHEFAHVLGLPDFYSTASTVADTPGKWSLMDRGNYLDDGRTPCRLSAYEKFFLGWAEPITLSADSRLSLSAEVGNAYIIPGPSDSEYFILENRAQAGWDAFLPGHGMLVWHVDYDPSCWENNSVNNDPKRTRLNIVKAAPGSDVTGDSDNAFPGTAGITSVMLTDHEGLAVAPELTAISEADGVVTLSAGSPSNDIPATPAPPKLSAVDYNAISVQIDQPGEYLLYLTSEADERSYPVGGWYRRKITGGSTVVDALHASAVYGAVIQRVDGMALSLPSGSAYVTTPESRISQIVPVALPATNVAADSFTACWQPFEEADSYLITLRQQVDGPLLTEVVDFSNGLTLPASWATTAKSTMALDGYYGEEQPSLCLDSDQAMLQSPFYDNPFDAVEFWMRGMDTDDQCRLEVRMLVNGVWKTVESVVPDNRAGHVYRYDGLQRTRSLMLRVSNPTGAGRVVVDDVRIERPGAKEYVTLFEDAYAGFGDRFTIGNLEPEQTYVYTLRGTDGHALSLPSNSVTVRTLESSAVAPPRMEQPLVDLSGRRLTVDAPADADILLTDLQGRVVAHARGCLSISLSPGLYALRLPSGSRKILVR